MKRKLKHIGLISLVFIGVWSLSLLVEAKEPELEFGNIPSIEWPDLEPLSYKHIRAREICSMARSKGFSGKDCPLLIAHLYTENGAFSEDRDGDNGCSLGMIQWNFCVHEGMKARQWVKKNPEWGDWRFQVNFYLDQINLRKEKYGSLTDAISSWNWGAHPRYIKKVQSHVAYAKSLL